MKIKSKNKGITLIALVISIIVMLILVAVSISMAVNGGLFNYAGKAVGDTQNAIDKEKELAEGRIKVGNTWYDSLQDVAEGKPSENQGDGTGATPDDDEPGEPVEGNNGETFSAPYKTTVKDNYEDKEGNKATIPAGFSVGTSDEINKISTGLVIRDANGNEFVWIPVTEDLANPYTTSSYGESEPKELTSTYSSSSAAYDHQDTLDYLYGENYYNYAKDFNYAEEYEKMVDRVNYYDGFYIGRYETTIDGEGNIGSKYNTKVLTAGDQFTHNDTSYYYRWYGLYYFQKNANVTGNKEDVQTAMIYGQLWDKAMVYIRTQKEAGKTNYNVGSSTSEWHGSSNGHTGVVNSGQANKTTVGVDGAIGDEALNIWDLESNAYEWTQEASSTDYRVVRGGFYYDSFYASDRNLFFSPYNYYGSDVSSRLALYIK